MKKFWPLMVICLIGISVIILVAQGKMARQHWEMKSCATLNCVTDFLNALPPDSALDAKITTINSQRSFLGTLSDPYKIWYRK